MQSVPEVIKSIQPQIKVSDVPNKIRFMLVSTHLQQYTGYSRVSHNIIQQLSKNTNISLIHFGFQRHPQAKSDFREYPSGIDVIDAAAAEAGAATAAGANPQQFQGFGFEQLPGAIAAKKPAVILIYNDMSIVAKFLEEIRKSGIPRTFKIWLYVDQVYTCQMSGYIDIINRDADRVFAFTKFWKKCLKGQGVNRPIDIITHGFDSNLYFPVAKEVVRKQMGLPANAFILLNLNRNQPRKRLDLLVIAFVELLVKNPQKLILLMCVCDKGDKGGWWLHELFKRELEMRGINPKQFEARLLITSQDMTFRDEEINLFYNLADLGVSTADGEGWGLCNFEQMGCGIPQVVGDIGGFKEFCTAENTNMVKPKFRYYLPMVFSPVGGEAEACDPHDICCAIEDYLFDSDKRERHGKAARETVLGFTWEKAVSQLVKRLMEERQSREDDE